MEPNKTPNTDLTSKMRYDFLVKIKMVGDSAVGKSSIVMRFCDDSFTDNTMPTIGTHILKFLTRKFRSRLQVQDIRCG